MQTQRHAMSFVNLKDTDKADIVNTILAQNTTIVAATESEKFFKSDDTYVLINN